MTEAERRVSLRASIILQVLTEATEASSAGEAVQRFLESIVRISKSTCGYIGRVSRESITVTCAVGMSDERKAQERRVGFGIVGKAVATECVIWASTAAQRDEVGAAGGLYESELAIPLKVGHRVLAVLNLHSKERDAYDEEFRQLIQICVAPIGWMILVENTAREWSEDLFALASFFDRITSEADTEALLQSALTVAQAWMSAQCVWLGIYDVVRKRLVPRFGIGVEVPADSRGLPPDGDAFAFYYQAMRQEGPQSREVVGHTELCYPENVRQEVVYPLLMAHEPVGVLVLATDVSFRSWAGAGPPATGGSLQKDLLTLLTRVIAFIEMQDRVASRAGQLDDQLFSNTLLLLNGLVSSQLAHEVTNGLGDIVGTLSPLVGKRTFSDLESRNFREQFDRLRELSRLKHQLLFSRTPEPMEFSVNALVLQEKRVLERHAFEYRGRWDASHGEERRIQIECVLDEKLDRGRGHDIQGVPAYVRLILRNLMVNAVEASRVGGTVGVATEWDDGQANYPVVISVSDHGEGISAEAKHRMFEPFYSTKQGGFGIGLALVKKLVEILDCPFDVVTKPGRGTTFTLRLARVAALRHVR